MKRLAFAFLPLLLGLGCEKAPVTMDELKVPQGFRYDMSQKVTTDLVIVDAQGNPLANRAIRAYAPSKDGTAATEHLFFQSKTDANGQVKTPLRIPAYWKDVVVVADGASPQKVDIASGSIAARITVAN